MSEGAVEGAVETPLWRAARVVAWAALALPFVLNVDAQWLKLDDITMGEILSGPSPVSVVKEIVLTRTTPHVRFAFLYHLVLAPFFRGWFESRAVVNAFFLSVVGALLLAGAVLAAPLRRRPVAWLGAVGMYATAVLSSRTWSTLEFKTATYLPAAFCVAVATLALGRWMSAEEAAPPRKLALAWVVAAIASFHTAEMALVVVLLLGAALVVRGRLPWPVLVGVAAWPFAFWALNMATAPRPLGLVGAAAGGVHPVSVLSGAYRMLRYPLAFEAKLAAATVGLAIVLVAARRPFRAALADALELLAFPAAAGVMILLTEMRSPGYSDDRYLCFQQLCFCAGAMLAITTLVRWRPRWGTAAAIAAGALAAGQLSTRVPALFRRADARRDELISTFAMQRELRAFLDARPADRAARELVVFVRDWRTEVERGDPIDSTFLGASWAQASFGKSYVCSPGRPCPIITFRPNTTWLWTPLSRAERADLCRRLPSADVLVIEDRRVGPVPVALPPAGTSDCPTWLAASGLVQPADPPPRSP